MASSHHARKEKTKKSFQKLALAVQQIERGEFEVERRPADGAQGWASLLRGNERFAKGELVGFLEHIAEEINPITRHLLVAGQKPFATVVTCSDSRVAPELIFDQGLGEIFVIRVAGNVLDTLTLGSIEYGTKELGSELLVIMGHQSCGAVTAAMKLDEPPTGNIGQGILQKIIPSTNKAKKHCSDPVEALDYAVKENVRQAKSYILENSHVVKDLLDSQKLTLIMAEYYLDSGFVIPFE